MLYVIIFLNLQYAWHVLQELSHVVFNLPYALNVLEELIRDIDESQKYKVT